MGNSALTKSVADIDRLRGDFDAHEQLAGERFETLEKRIDDLENSRSPITGANRTPIRMPFPHALANEGFTPPKD